MLQAVITLVVALVIALGAFLHMYKKCDSMIAHLIFLVACIVAIFVVFSMYIQYVQYFAVMYWGM